MAWPSWDVKLEQEWQRCLLAPQAYLTGMILHCGYLEGKNNPWEFYPGSWNNHKQKWEAEGRGTLILEKFIFFSSEAQVKAEAAEAEAQRLAAIRRQNEQMMQERERLHQEQVRQMEIAQQNWLAEQQKMQQQQMQVFINCFISPLPVTMRVCSSGKEGEAARSCGSQQGVWSQKAWV